MIKNSGNLGDVKSNKFDCDWPWFEWEYVRTVFVSLYCRVDNYNEGIEVDVKSPLDGNLHTWNFLNNTWEYNNIMILKWLDANWWVNECWKWCEEFDMNDRRCPSFFFVN